MTFGSVTFSDSTFSDGARAAAGGGTANGVLSAAGSATITFVGASLRASSLSGAGTSTNSFVGSSLVSSVLSGASVSTNNFVGKSLVASVLSITGTSTNSFVGSSVVAGQGSFSMSGVGAASFVSSALISSVLSSSGAGLASFLTNALGVVTTTKGGAGRGNNLTLKQKKKLKAVINQEWLKAEQTAQELFLERLGHAEPAKVKIEKLTTAQSLAEVIEALKALSKETVTLPEQQAVLKSINKTIIDKSEKPVEKVNTIEQKVAAFEKRLNDLEALVMAVMTEVM